MRVRLIALSCLLAFGCKDEEAPEQDTPAPSESAPTKQDSADDGAGAPGRGLAATFQDAMSGKRKVKSLKLIPKGAVMLAGANVQELVSRPIWSTLETAFKGRQRDQMKAATKCGVGPDKWRRFVFGVAGNGDDMAMVVEAEGLGTRPVLDCLVQEIGNFELSEDGKRLSDYTGGGIVLGDDAIAFANPAWMPLLEKRIEGEGQAAIDDIGPGLARADQTKTLWFAGKTHDELKAASAMLGADIQDYSAWVDLRDGMNLKISFAVPDPAKTRSELDAKWQGLKNMASQVLPSAVVDSVKLTDDGKLVHIEAKASESDLRELASEVGKGF